MSRKHTKKNHLFLNWLKANRSRFKHEPIVVRREKNYIELRLAGITNALRMRFNSSNGITVSVYWLGEHCDFLGGCEVAEQKSKEGYYCAFCYEELREYYPTREQLWIQHGFETFFEWCNTELAESQWLEIEMGCGTSARLYKEKPPVTDRGEDRKQYITPVHVSSLRTKLAS